MNTLITITPSHYCEKARWALDRAGIPFREEAHLPLVHWAFALPRTGTRTVPILLTKEGKFSDSVDIVKFADRHLRPEVRLYPVEQKAHDEVTHWVTRFDSELGVLARRYAYSVIVHEPELFSAIMSPGLSRVERGVLRVGNNAMRKVMTKAFAIRPGVGERMLSRIHKLYD